MLQNEKTKSALDDSESALSLYLREINHIPLITREKENELAIRAQAGDQVARTELAQAHLRFVVNVAKKFQNRGVPLSDLISEGNVGLLHAIERFDPEKGYHFISYAVWWIRQGILKALVEKSCGIRLPQNRVSDLSQIQNLRKMLLTDGQRDDPETIAKILKIDVAIVRDLINVSRDYVSLDAPVASDQQKKLGELLEDGIYEKPMDKLDFEELQHCIQDALSSLSDKEAQVIEFRFGLNGNKSLSLKQIGEKFGLTKERIRQIEKTAIEKLRHPNRSKRLMEFIA
ncbi:MAG: sigma-70 family RNA polymerase sigma factor [Spirochaetia bacterium]